MGEAFQRDDRDRFVMIETSSDFTFSLHFYPPNLFQPSHVDPLPGVSLVLCGEVLEDVGGRCQVRSAKHVSIKPAGVKHSATIGAHGALILAFHALTQAGWDAVGHRGGWTWRRMDGDDVRFLIGNGPARAKLEQLTRSARPTPDLRSAPVWLEEGRARLSITPNLTTRELASAAGVHPVYFARAFQRWCGRSPTRFRSEVRTAMAVGHAHFEGVSATASALDAGFADQAHMCRAVRRMTGLTLRELRRLDPIVHLGLH